MLFHSYEKVPIRICVMFLFWTAFPGDAPKPSHAQLCRVIWVCVRMRWVRGFPLVDPAPHHGTWAFQGPSSGRTSCTKGRVPLGTHTHPLRQSWWQEPQHLGCSLCMSCVGLSYVLYIIRTVFSYCIHIVLLCSFNYISIIYCTMLVIFVYIYLNTSSFGLPPFELNKV